MLGRNRNTMAQSVSERVGIGRHWAGRYRKAVRRVRTMGSLLVWFSQDGSEQKQVVLCEKVVSMHTRSSSTVSS